MNYIDDMQNIARTRYDQIYRDIQKLQFFDFPDYPNVGDSAIALGQLAYFRRSNIEVEAAYCIGTINKQALKRPTHAAINGGGNIAGFFEGIDNHRNRISTELNPDAILVQAPQSIHFKTDSARSKFEKNFASRPSLRMSVRDREALDVIEPMLPKSILAPDAVHHLGAIPSNPPSQRALILARRDSESTGANLPPDSIDWNKDPSRLRRRTSLRWKAKYLGRFGNLLNLNVDGWTKVAQERLDRGVAALSPGEIVVTDRLHAMLIALQMGRTVYAVDNNNQKLTKYADTWFGSSNPDVAFYSNFHTAINAIN